MNCMKAESWSHLGNHEDKDGKLEQIKTNRGKHSSAILLVYSYEQASLVRTTLLLTILISMTFILFFCYCKLTESLASIST